MKRFAIITNREGFFASPCFIYPILILFIVLSSIFLLFYGGPVALGDIDTDAIILWQIRYPKLLASLLVGASLSLTGYIFQSVLRNPMADPYVLGVSSGSALFVSMVLVFSSSVSVFGMELASFAGALLAVFLLLFIFRLLMGNSLVIILIGIGLSFFFSSATTALMSYMEGDKLVYMNSWLVGNISMPGFTELYFLLTMFVVVFTLSLLFSNSLDILQFGEDFSVSSGLNHRSYSMLFIISASLLTATAVTVCGTIGFVGLVVPHIGRLLFKGISLKMIPLIVLLGAGFLTLCTAIAGILSFNFDVPVGAITSFIGAPVLLYLIYRRYKVRQ